MKTWLNNFERENIDAIKYIVRVPIFMFQTESSLIMNWQLQS